MITQVAKPLVKQSSGEKYKRTQQRASAKLEFYLYCYRLVHTTISCPPHILLKATMYTLCALTSSSRSFYHVLGLWHYIMWPVMWLQCHMPLHHQEKRKRNIKSRKIDKRKRKMLVFKVFHNILWYGEHCLPLISLLYPHIIVSPPKVYFCEDLLCFNIFQDIWY